MSILFFGSGPSLATETTQTWLEEREHGRLAFVLVFEGYDLAYTTHSDVAGISLAFQGTHWTSVRGGLNLIGELGYSCQPFDAKIDVPYQQFQILDHDDALLGTLFREGSSDAITAELATSIDCDDTAIVSATDISDFPASGTIYIGGEKITYSSKNDGTKTFTASARGVGAIYGTSADPDSFAQPHLVDDADGDNGQKPRISTERSTWYNTRVGLYILHQDDEGAWSSPTNDTAHLYWAGMIRTWDEAGDGWVSLGCIHVMDSLRTTLLARQFRGHLQEGLWWTDEMAQIRVSVTYGTGTSSTTEESDWITLAGSGARKSHNELSDLINQALLDLIDGATLTADLRSLSLVMGSSDDSGDVQRYELRGQVDTGTNDAWAATLFVHPALAALFGWDTNSLLLVVSTDQIASRITAFQRAANSSELAARATGPALRLVMARAGTVKIDIADVESGSTFEVQPTIPTGFDGRSAADGFLRVGDNVYLVEQLTDTQFKILDFTVRLGNAGREGDAALFEQAGDRTFTVPDDGICEPIKVEQIWCETTMIGAMFLRLLASTGTGSYNHTNASAPTLPLTPGGTWDMMPQSVSVGVPWTMIDVVSVLGLGNTPYWLILDKPTPFIELFEKALQFTNQHCVWRNGQISVVNEGLDSAESASADVVSLTDENKAVAIQSASERVIERTRSSRGTEGIINRVTLKYHRNLGGDFERSVTVNSLASQSDFRQARGVVMEARGIYDDLGDVAGAAVTGWQRDVAAEALALYSRPVSTIERSYDFSLVTKLYPGCRVSIVDDSLIDPVSGTRGVNGLLGWIVSCSFNWDTGVGKLRALYIPEVSAHYAPFAPSARVDSSYNSGLFVDGYNSSTKWLRLEQHAYSNSNEDTDVTFFETGDKVRVTQIDPVGAPITWADTIAGVDSGNDQVTLTTGLGGWAAGDRFVLTFDDASTVTQGQLTRGAFIADEDDLSTGVAARDAYLFGTNPAESRWDAPTYVTRYSRPRSFDDDVGEPLSSHLVADVQDFANSALSYHCARVLVNDQLNTATNTTGALQANNRSLVYGPVRIPLYGGGGRPLRVKVYAKMGAAATTGTLRVVLSSSMVRGALEYRVMYADEAQQYHEFTITNDTSYEFTAAAEVAPAVVQGQPSYCWLTVDALITDASHQLFFKGVYVAEAND